MTNSKILLFTSLIILLTGCAGNSANQGLQSGTYNADTFKAAYEANPQMIATQRIENPNNVRRVPNSHYVQRVPESHKDQRLSNNDFNEISNFLGALANAVSGGSTYTQQSRSHYSSTGMKRNTLIRQSGGNFYDTRTKSIWIRQSGGNYYNTGTGDTLIKQSKGNFYDTRSGGTWIKLSNGRYHDTATGRTSMQFGNFTYTTKGRSKNNINFSSGTELELPNLSL